jgi:hypothetical protein
VRRLALLLAAGLLTSSCATSTRGPSQPVAQEQLVGPEGVDVAAARQTALAFLSAYAASPSGVAGLRDLVAGSDLRSWVRWLDVQNREFDGTISGATDVRSAAFVASVPIRRAIGAEIDVSASVTFSFTPTTGDAFERTRILDGPMTLIRTGTAEWRVVDVTRDGVSMDAGITRLDGQVHRLAGVTVRLDSVFRFVPNWQFNLVVTNDTRSAIGLDPSAAALVVRQAGGVQAVPTTPTRSLAAIAPGASVEALLAVPFQDSDRGRALSLPFLSADGKLRRFVFRLDGLIDPSSGPSTGAGSPTPAPS